jgi:RNA polymerase-binding transcription factor DksA
MNYTIEQTIRKPPIQPGAIWGLLQAERSEVCQTLLTKERPVNTISGTHETEAVDESIREAEWRHRQNLQECLRRIDDALDRLIEGRYGHCGDCGTAIEDKRLAADPAASLCIACQRRAEGERAFAKL